MLALIQHGCDVSLCHLAKLGGGWMDGMGWGVGRIVPSWMCPQETRLDALVGGSHGVSS